VLVDTGMGLNDVLDPHACPTFRPCRDARMAGVGARNEGVTVVVI